MKYLLLVAGLVAALLYADVTHAAMIINADKGLAIVGVNTGKGWNAVKLPPGGNFNTGNMPAKFSVGNKPPVEARAGDRLVLKGGVITMEQLEKPADVKEENPAAATVPRATYR